MSEAAAPATAARRRAPRGRGTELRAEILTAAMDLLSETGDEQAVSVRAVAQRVGVSVPSIYLHFADKSALLDAVCDQVFEALHVRLRAAGEAADNPFEGLRAQGNAYVHFALENAEQYRLVMMLKRTEHSAEQVIAAGAFGYLVDSVRQCAAEGVYDGDPVELALGLWATAHGIAALLIAKPNFPWPDVDRFIDNTICMAGVGLAVTERLDCTGAVPLPQLVAALNSLRG